RSSGLATVGLVAIFVRSGAIRTPSHRPRLRAPKRGSHRDGL
ncbi:uncharacterized protein METZ01_LOCUS321324, partial [marine metagenome]